MTDLESLLTPTALSETLASRDSDKSALGNVGQRLAETVAWCRPRANVQEPQASLRADELRPALLNATRADAVVGLCLIRQRALRGPVARLEISDRPAAGRLLLYFPDADLSDGAAEEESSGYFDTHNAPPWDTWVAFLHERGNADISFRQYLLAWVPGPFLQLAERGVEANPEECLQWLDESTTLLRSLLKL